MRNHILLLWIIIAICNFYELFTDQWENDEWYVPSWAACILFSLIEIVYWVGYLIWNYCK